MADGYDWQLHARLRAMQETDGGSLHRFYCWAAWRRLRAQVMSECHGECVDCLAESPARYTPAECVHHVHEVDSEPGYALSPWVPAPGGERVRNLVPLCHRHHDERHGRFADRMRRSETAGVPLTIERW